MKPLKGYGRYSTFTAPCTIMEPRTATRNATRRLLAAASRMRKPARCRRRLRRGAGGWVQVQHTPRGSGRVWRGRRAGSAHARRRRHLKTPSEHARPPPPAARGAGGGAALRDGLTCPRSPLPFPAVAPADGCSCHASERPVAVVSRRRCGGTTPEAWTRLPAARGPQLTLKLRPQAPSAPVPLPQRKPLVRGALPPAPCQIPGLVSVTCRRTANEVCPPLGSSAGRLAFREGWRTKMEAGERAADVGSCPPPPPLFGGGR